MAILKGIISKMNGSAGSLTFKQTGGQTVVSEKVTQTTDAKTELQQKQRMKWANVIRMYQVLRPYMKLAFGGSQNGRTDYNKFVSVNLALQPVYLTKAEVNAGACVVAPYKITQGKLKSISVAGKAGEAVTNISLGTLTITADTTVAEFSNAVVQHNKFFEYGDQITYFLVSQEINDVTATPMADVDACCIVLDKNKDAKLLSLVNPRGFASRDGYLAAQTDADFGNHGMVWIHSRKNTNDGSTMVSAQFLVCDNSILAQYQGQDAYDTAVNSYGGANTVYLTPSGTLKPVSSESDGTIQRGRPEEMVGAHCKNRNQHSIGICYVGGLSEDGHPKDTRTRAQKRALLQLIRELKQKYPRALIMGHNVFNPQKSCPCFDAAEEYKDLQPNSNISQ